MHKHEIIKQHIKADTPFTIQNKSICFLKGNRKPEITAGSSLLGKIQDKLKHTGRLYYGLTNLFKPVWISKGMTKHFKDTLQRNSNGAIVLNLGSGPQIILNRPDIINIDLYAFDEVDIIANAEDIPLKDGSADLILNQSMLEHVRYPELVVQEMHRLLRPGGEIFCYVPFMAPFHAAPHDYHRWTMPGLRTLFQKFDQVDIGIGAGPASGMLWLMQEWCALLFSFGSRHLHDILFLIFMVLTSPLKMLDIFMVHLPYAEKITSGFYISAKK